MSEIKYTTDGKKVVVIGNLNSVEKIVQEIFVIDGSEIPSGEHFVVKSLHDAPAVSWKERNLAELEARYKKESAEYERDIDRIRKDYRNKSNEFRAKFKYIASAIKNADESSFNTLCDFICGNIKYIVISQYTPELVSFADFNQMYDGNLRLMSIFGKDDGTFTYAVGDYHDYSGSNKMFIPFKNYDDAFEKFREILLSKDITSKLLKIAERYNIEYPTDKIQEYVDKQIKSLEGNISRYNADIEKWNEMIVETKKLTK